VFATVRTGDRPTRAPSRASALRAGSPSPPRRPRRRHSGVRPVRPTRSGGIPPPRASRPLRDPRPRAATRSPCGPVHPLPVPGRPRCWALCYKMCKLVIATGSPPAVRIQGTRCARRRGSPPVPSGLGMACGAHALRAEFVALEDPTDGDRPSLFTTPVSRSTSMSGRETRARRSRTPSLELPLGSRRTRSNRIRIRCSRSIGCGCKAARSRSDHLRTRIVRRATVAFDSTPFVGSG
jgi:hypothetical protein